MGNISPHPKIRLATAADAPALVGIKTPYVTDTAYNFAWEPPTADEFAREIDETLARYPFIVAEDAEAGAGGLVGYAQAEPYRLRKSDSWNVELTIYLATDARGRGMGTALYRALLDLLRLQHVQNAYACITAGNEASLAFHRSLGFTEVGRFPATGYKLGAWHETVYLWKPLGDHSCPPPAFAPFPALDRDSVKAVLANGNERPAAPRKLMPR